MDALTRWHKNLFVTFSPPIKEGQPQKERKTEKKEHDKGEQSEQSRTNVGYGRHSRIA